MPVGTIRNTDQMVLRWRELAGYTYWHYAALAKGRECDSDLLCSRMQVGQRLRGGKPAVRCRLDAAEVPVMFVRDGSKAAAMVLK
jgi:hypothetical protein